MARRYDRRTFIRGAALGGGAIVLIGAPPANARKLRLARDAAFRQGVASGEPGPRAITLWSRLEGLDKPALVGVEVARDAGFRKVIHRDRLVAEAKHDWTVRTRLAGGPLQPGEQYHYRFVTKDGSSPAGRFRTAWPAGSREPVTIAFFSCQEWGAGFYAAHRDLARRDVDLVVCLGDYIYEKTYAEQPVRENQAAEDGEAQTLGDYRRTYGLYHTDPNLLEVRRRFPLVAIWDDHEVEDNYADGLGGGQAQHRRIPFAQRKRNGYRAFFEHMPRRLRADFRTYGSIPLGSAELFLLDSRQFRGDQPCNPSDGALSQPCPPATTDDPSRTLLGAPQKAWLKLALQSSKARWKLIANQVMITSLDAPPRNPLNTDSWDGYGADRAAILGHVAANGIEDVSFVTGDIHTFFAGDVTSSGRRTLRDPDLPDPVNGPLIATEFVGSSITSQGIVDRAASTEEQRVAASAGADAAVLGNNPQMVYSNQAYKGYGLLEAGEALRVRYQAVHDARKQDSTVFTLRRFRVDSGRAAIIDEGGPVPLPSPSAPAPAPPGVPGIPPIPGVLGRAS
jgi:alkaline phosphatase D